MTQITEAMIEAGAREIVAWQKCFASFNGIELSKAAHRIYTAMHRASSIPEPEAASEAVLGVGDGSGQLFVHGSYDAIKRVQDMIFELERVRDASRPQAANAKVLAAGVRGILHKHGGMDAVGEWTARASQEIAEYICATRPEAASSDEDAEFLRQAADCADASGDVVSISTMDARRLANRLSAEPEAVTLREALTEIAKGEGAFNRDPLIHAENTIESMKEIARAALTNVSSRAK